MKDFAALLALSISDLEKELKSARREFVKIKMGVRTGQEKNTSKYGVYKKYIAQILTAKREKEISEPVL